MTKGGERGNLPYLSALILAVLVGLTILLGLAQLAPITVLYRYGYLANVAGYVALVLISATGAMMLFRKPMLRKVRDPDAVLAVHVGLAGVGGGFLVFHVGFFLLFPVSIPVLFGYVATYTALAVWVTGAFFFEGLRNSLFYHGLLSLVAISLMAVHVFSAGRGLPDIVAGAVLVVMACSVLAVAFKRFAEISRMRGTRTDSLP